MLKSNPYQVSRPITDPNDLFGRRTEFDLIYQMLLSGESVNIMGPRRIGKSSFLRVLPQPEIQQRVLEKAVFDDQTMFVFVDMESQKTLAAKWLTAVTKHLADDPVEQFIGAFRTNVSESK